MYNILYIFVSRWSLSLWHGAHWTVFCNALWLLWGCLSTSAYLRICNVHCPVNQQLTQSFYNHNLCRLLPGTVSVKFTLVTVVDKDIERHRHLSNQTRSGRMVSNTQVRPPVFKYSGCLRWLTVIFKVWQLDNLIFQDHRTGNLFSRVLHNYRSKSVVTFPDRDFALPAVIQFVANTSVKKQP